MLRHENAVLRRQLARPVRCEPADRFWLAALSALIARSGRQEVFPVAPGTLPAWHRRLIAAKWDYSARRTRTGRPPTRAALKKLVLQLARESGRWGHRRIQGEPARLGHPIAASTVGEVLDAAGIEPAPRRTGPAWREFLTDQAQGIIAVDFLHRDTALGRRLCALVFLEHGTRRLRITGVTAHPAREWAVQQARNLSADLGTRNEAHARQVLAAYERHYDEHRPHRVRNQLPPGADQQPVATHEPEGRRLLRARILGGVIDEYRYAA